MGIKNPGGVYYWENYKLVIAMEDNFSTVNSTAGPTKSVKKKFIEVFASGKLPAIAKIISREKVFLSTVWNFFVHGINCVPCSWTINEMHMWLKDWKVTLSNVHSLPIQNLSNFPGVIPLNMYAITTTTTISRSNGNTKPKIISKK